MNYQKKEENQYYECLIWQEKRRQFYQQQTVRILGMEVSRQKMESFISFVLLTLISYTIILMIEKSNIVKHKLLIEFLAGFIVIFFVTDFLIIDAI
jgi:hypothetical protein